MFRVGWPDIFVRVFWQGNCHKMDEWMSIGGFVFDRNQLYEVMSHVKFDGILVPELRFRNPEHLRVFSAGKLSC